jgi:hypothetical protein
MFTGLWVVLLNYSAGEGWGWPSLAAAIALVVASLVSVISPRIVFYASALLALVLDVSLLAGSALNQITILTLALGAVTLVTAIFAARREGRVSEQSNPMNLPVFG